MQAGCQLPGRRWRGTWAVLKGDERKDTLFILCDVVSSATCVWQKTSCKVNPCSFQWPEGQPVMLHLCLLVRINLLSSNMGDLWEQRECCQ